VRKSWVLYQQGVLADEVAELRKCTFKKQHQGVG
jgi:hypothetical protein